MSGVRGSQPFLDRPDDGRAPDPGVCLRIIRPRLRIGQIHGRLELPDRVKLLAEALGIGFPYEWAAYRDEWHFVSVILLARTHEHINRAVDARNPEIRPGRREYTGAGG